MDIRHQYFELVLSHSHKIQKPFDLKDGFTTLFYTVVVECIASEYIVNRRGKFFSASGVCVFSDGERHLHTLDLLFFSSS